jgi:NAD(P)-dependent dehydrogenase (short-subunit alcohol dehydrogenase family)
VVPCAPVALADLSSFDSVGFHVVPDTGGVAEAFVECCVAAGKPAPTIGASIPGGVTRVLLLNPLSPCHTTADTETLVLDTFHSLRSFGAAHRTQRVEIFVVQDLGGDFGLVSDPGVRAALGAVAGLAKSAAREWPRASVRVLDLPTGANPAEQAARIYAELAMPHGNEIEVGLAAGRRVTPRLVAVKPSVAPSHARPADEVWIVSGGARGVTAACLQALARRGPLRFALLGRTPIDEPEISAAHGHMGDVELKRALLDHVRVQGIKLTPVQLQRQVSGIVAAREARASCEALRAAGAEVCYFETDIADASAVAEVVSRVRAEWGPIRGVVHAAGVLADKALHEKTDEQFLSVYRTKVDGFHALLAATRDEPLAAIACFSSVAARAGNAGQADYAAANEALNKLCQAEQHRRGSACLVRSINWGPWDGGMVSPGLKSHFASLGISLIPLQAGAEIFADLMTGLLPTTVECVVGANLNFGEARL